MLSRMTKTATTTKMASSPNNEDGNKFVVKVLEGFHHKVPEDVKSALQSIEEAFNLPFTEWTEAERYQAGTIVDATHLGPFPAPAELATLGF